MKVDPYVRSIDEFETQLIDAIKSATCRLYLDTSTLMWALRINAGARDEFIEWCRSFGSRIKVPVWAAHELQRHLLEGTVLKNVRKTASESEKKLHDFMSLVTERADDHMAQAIGAGSSSTLLAKANLIQGEFRRLSKAVQTDNVSEANQKITDFVNEFVLDTDVSEVAKELSLSGDFRYSHRVPPGFQDHPKPENKYGDLIIWEEILRDSTGVTSNGSAEACIFVSQDQKTDWISAAPLIEADNGPEKPNRDHAKDVPLAHPLLQHEYEKRGATGGVFVISPRRLSIIATKVIKEQADPTLSVDEWGRVSYLDGLVANLTNTETMPNEDRAAVSSGLTVSSNATAQPTSANITHDALSIDEVFEGSNSNRLDSIRSQKLGDLESIWDKWLDEVRSGKLAPLAFGRLLGSTTDQSAIPAIGAVLARALAKLSSGANVRVLFGMGAALYFSKADTLRSSPSNKLGELFLALSSEAFFAEGLASLTSALKAAGMNTTFLPGSIEKVGLEIISSGSSPKTVTEIRIDGQVVTQDSVQEPDNTIETLLRASGRTVSGAQLQTLVCNTYIIEPDRMANPYDKRKFHIRPEMGLVRLDHTNPEGFVLPTED